MKSDVLSWTGTVGFASLDNNSYYQSVSAREPTMNFKLGTLPLFFTFEIISTLKVKNAMVHFEPSSIYGTREGYQEVLLVASLDKTNHFVKSKAFKTAVIGGVSMLPRNEMAKPPRENGKYGSDTRFTRVQEMKQAWSPHMSHSGSIQPQFQ